MLLFFPNSQIVSFQNLTTVLLATRTNRLYLRPHVRLVILTARTFGAVNEYPSLYEMYKAMLISFFSSPKYLLNFIVHFWPVNIFNGISNVPSPIFDFPLNMYYAIKRNKEIRLFAFLGINVKFWREILLTFFNFYAVTKFHR